MNPFITFEGGEGSGKTLQSKLLANFLRMEKKREVVLTREPGGCPLSEEIRNILVVGDPEKLSSLTEALLYLAARSEHWNKVINPALEANKIVLSDRFHDSSIVYQGVCKNVPFDVLNIVFERITDNRYPDRTYLIDLPPRVGIKRSLDRKENIETRFEKMDIKFHEKVRESFLNLASQNPSRFLVVDGMLSVSEIHEIIKSDVEKFL